MEALLIGGVVVAAFGGLMYFISRQRTKGDQSVKNQIKESEKLVGEVRGRQADRLADDSDDLDESTLAEIKRLRKKRNGR